MKKSREQLIDEIVENFNWDKVYRTMEALSWTWADNGYEIPSTGKLITTATRLLRDVYDGAEKEQYTYLSGTGGFEAVCFVDLTPVEVFYNLID